MSLTNNAVKAGENKQKQIDAKTTNAIHAVFSAYSKKQAPYCIEPRKTVFYKTEFPDMTFHNPIYDAYYSEKRREELKKQYSMNLGIELEWQNSLYDKNGFIHGQSRAPIHQMMLDKEKASVAACEEIAITNALNAVGMHVRLSDVILNASANEYTILNGRLGTNVYKGDDILRSYGVNTKRISYLEAEYNITNEKYKDGQVFVMSYWNDTINGTNIGNPFDQIHTVAAVYEDLNGEKALTVYNMYNKDDVYRRYDTVHELLNQNTNHGKIIAIYEVNKE